MEQRELYRPVGLFELELIAESGYTAFPPRLAHQPIFYPVLNMDYARQIARDWNTRDAASGYMGAVTAFAVDPDYLAQFDEQLVGAAEHRELWIPAEQLAVFNAHLRGKIRVIEVFYGDEFAGDRQW
ncbi:MAG: hypothetical protein JNL42_09520 [Anaerolineae bacterium]|nr:hypothetical protein [Anaerolineae bacterium]